MPLGHLVAADSRVLKGHRKHSLTQHSMSSSAAAAVVADAAEAAAPAAAAHAPGMHDRLAALKAERQSLKRQLQQASREVKAQAGPGTMSSLCAIFVLVHMYRDYMPPCTFIFCISTFVWLKLH